MNPVIRDLWADALEDGNHMQTRGGLHMVPDAEPRPLVQGEVPDGKCCLGVLCELAVLAGVCERRKESVGRWYEYGTPEEFGRAGANSGTLPASVMRWAGLATSNPLLDGGNAASTLNDTGPDRRYGIPERGPLTFPEIAALVRALPGEVQE